MEGWPGWVGLGGLIKWYTHKRSPIPLLTYSLELTCAVFIIGMIQMLMSLDSGLRISDDGDMTIIPVLAFRLEPDPSFPPGLLTVDGECVDYGPIQAQVLPSMARVMSIQHNSDDWFFIFMRSVVFFCHSTSAVVVFHVQYCEHALRLNSLFTYTHYIIIIIIITVIIIIVIIIVYCNLYIHIYMHVLTYMLPIQLIDIWMFPGGY